jgi:hypothetical protein
MNNPMQFMNFLKGVKNPKDAVINMIKSNNNPMVKNLVEMAEKGDNKGIETFARNMFKEQGRDFDSEIKQFMNNFK